MGPNFENMFNPETWRNSVCIANHRLFDNLKSKGARTLAGGVILASLFLSACGAPINAEPKVPSTPTDPNKSNTSYTYECTIEGIQQSTQSKASVTSTSVSEEPIAVPQSFTEFQEKYPSKLSTDHTLTAVYCDVSIIEESNGLTTKTTTKVTVPLPTQTSEPEK